MRNKWLTPTHRPAGSSNAQPSSSRMSNIALGAGSDSCEHCGRSFSTYAYLTLHLRSCKPAKRSLASLLEDTKEYWENRKRRKLAHPGVLFNASEDSSGGPPVPVSSAPRIVTSVYQTAPSLVATHSEDDETLIPTSHMDLDIPVAQRKGARQKRLPLRFREDDVLPEACGPIVIADEPHVEVPVPQEGPTLQRSMRTLLRQISKRNTFGVLKIYRIPVGEKITHDPDRTMTLVDLADAKPFRRRSGQLYGPFPNRSAFELAEWYWQSTQKSFSDFEKLIRIFGNRSFSIPDALKVNWRESFKILGANRDDLPEDSGNWIEDDGWKSTPIFIDVPFHKQQQNAGVQSYFAGHFRHRNLLSVIKEKIADYDESRMFHYQPYQATWKPKDSDAEVEVYGELYCSRAVREANEEIQKLPSTTTNEGLERVVVSLMFWSDATRMTDFGGSLLWPCYMFFGNESKYSRCQPSERLGRQVAYFIKLPPTFKEYLKDRNGGKLPTDVLISHCARELFQSQWCVLLDDDLIDAMENGIVLLCPDGIRRCFYPRIFTYSADYPEKVLIAGVRNNGGCPCHRCFIKKTDLAKLGAPTDTERRDQVRSEKEQQAKVAEARAIITSGYAVDTDQVEALLKPLSLVPTESSIPRRLSPLGFEILPTLVADLMHEFEIGSWKSLFIHLIRLLEAFSQSVTLTAELDSRYRATPAFGRDTIRKFGINASEMKRKAARNYEDLLQCAIPAFEGLLPEPHNTHLMILLYICAQWHALAKLRLHHDLTLDLLDYTTVRLGAQMRLFNHATCETKQTKELQKEADIRERREGKGKGKGAAVRKPAKFGVFTIKFHFLGDYSTIIRRYGTTDSYSTETGELCHRLPKSWFERTDKRRYEVQLSEIERRQARLASIRANLGGETVDPARSKASQAMDEAVDQSPDSRYSIGATRSFPVDVLSFAHDINIRCEDPYLKDTIPKLKQHLLPRILERMGFTSAEDVSRCDWANVALQDGRLFSHKLMRINYTTYDVRREQDVIHIETPQCNVMLLDSTSLSASEHPYIYLRIFGIFHAQVLYVGQLPDGTVRHVPHRIDFCWAHGYDFCRANAEFGLERASPIPLSSPAALSFIDPGDILRAVHLIPQFSLKHFDREAPAQRRWDNGKQELWNTYFINRFADRDLFMRYQYGMSIGHTYMYTNTNFPPRLPIPSIPPDFNYHLTRVAAPRLDDQHGSTADHQPAPMPVETGLGSGEGVEVDAAPELPNPGSALDEDEDEDEEEAPSYDDELDDDELLAREDMYGMMIHG